MFRFILFLILSPPLFISAKIPNAILYQFHNHTMVKTESKNGEYIQNALKTGYSVIHLLEKDKGKYQKFSKRYKSLNNVYIHNANPANELFQITQKIENPITFVLNSNYTENEFLLAQLNQIKKHKLKTHTIIIDNLQFLNSTIDELVTLFHDINPEYDIRIVNGVNHANNILIAYDLKTIFTRIYDEKHWGTNSVGEGFSGPGSLVKNAIDYMDYLEGFMKGHQIKTVVDAGCGDWEFSQFINWKGIDYKGYDVVSSVIKKNKKKFSDANIEFIHADFTKTDLPSTDLFLCKDVLQHLPNKTILEFLPQLKKFKYCLISNDVNRKTLSSDNKDGIPGGYRTLDLSKPPFNLKGKKVMTYGTEPKLLFLIETSQL